MGNSAYAILCFGLKLEEGAEQPWDVDHEGDVEEWWIAKTGFKPVNEFPFDDKGEYKKGFSDSDPRVDKYFTERRDWLKAHPFPYEVVMGGSFDFDENSYVIAIPKSIQKAEQGDIVDLRSEPSLDLHVTTDLVDFCILNGIDTEGLPGWKLTALYG